jgi:hypothetical protein
MEVNFSDFTNNREVHDYLIENSKKKVIKIESRLLDEDGVVLEHSDSFLENCGDVKYYFDDDESLEINRINSVALFVRGNGQKLIVDYVDDNDFEPSFINIINSELGLDFKVHMRRFNFNIKGNLSGDMYNSFKSDLDEICTRFNLEILTV